jgi:hypothetical protein
MILIAGCSGGEPLVPVSGTVTLGGKPLPGASVSLYPDVSKGNKSKSLPAAKSNAQGQYKVFTMGRAGAPVGSYKVVVFASESQKAADPKDSKKSSPALPKSILNPRYNQDSTTPLSVEVKAGASAAYDLKLEP